MATYKGIASWHSDVKNAGICKNWDNNGILGAYPYVFEMTTSASCNLTGCGKTLSRQICDSTVLVTHPCASRGANVKIAGCGPVMSKFCSDSGVYCRKSGYTGRIIDLSPAAFSFFVDLDYGTTTIEVTT